MKRILKHNTVAVIHSTETLYGSNRHI